MYVVFLLEEITHFFCLLCLLRFGGKGLFLIPLGVIAETLVSFFLGLIPSGMAR